MQQETQLFFYDLKNNLDVLYKYILRRILYTYAPMATSLFTDNL